MTITVAPTHRDRLRWRTELPLIAVVYALYSGVRLLIRGKASDAVRHGADILHYEQLIPLDPEHWLNRLLAKHAFLGVPADFAYASLHYLVTPAVLVWLWRHRPMHYRMARTWLMISTLIGLVGFTVLPTAPPRLLTGGYGFIDTMAQYSSYGWWGTDASAPRGMGQLTNQYAAMPSLHVGWALWCGLLLFRFGRHWSVRTLGAIYPVVTVLVVLGTANHYLMDVAAGVLVMGIGLALAKPALRVVEVLLVRWRARRQAAAVSASTTIASSEPSPATTDAGTKAASAGTEPHGDTSATTTPEVSAPFAGGAGVIVCVPRQISAPVSERGVSPAAEASAPAGDRARG
ncbi:phosphatase PAP2 family protein [Streptomyces sp. NBC_01450]|uniref:phosphatase PAP2 family protein n=1 Tax=Streptomyces sp. NBC_01450 TaxID=2903871 RepID=UPI002E334D92|nr:phosphatase PAP2 family protein [Streptomyces sp. NBC_01450]